MSKAADHLSTESLLADSKWLRALARGIVGEARADDVVQDTWLAVLRRPPRIFSNLRPWLRMVARNLSLRERDHESRRPALEARGARFEAQPGAADLVARANLRRSIVDAVLELEEPYRSTVLLRYFEDLPPRGIARAHGVPVATVRTRLRRGLDRLRARFDGEQSGMQAWLVVLAAPPRFGLGWLAGAIAMGTKAKISAAAVFLVLFGLGAWEWTRHRSLEADGAPLAAPQAAAGDSAEGPERSATSPAGSPVAGTDAIRPRAVSETPFEDLAIVGVALDARNDAPVEGVKARLDVRKWEGTPEEPAVEATTDRDGRFRIGVPKRNLVRGVTLLSAEFAPLVIDYIQNAIIKIATGDVYDLGTLRLERGARVSGRVVSAEDRAPVARAALFLRPRGYPISETLLGEARPVGRSEADGTFVLTERVPPIGGQEAILTAVSDEGVGWAFLAVIRDRETLDGIEIAIAGGAALRATVLDEAGKPVEGAWVRATPRFPPLGPPAYFVPNYSGDSLPEDRRGKFWRKTGADGEVVLRGLPLGREDARFAQYPTSPRGYDVTASHADYARAAPQSVLLDREEEAVVRIQLVPRAFCTIRGRVATEGGKPIEGARVGHRRQTAVVTTDREGVYRLERCDTTGGRAYLDARASGFASQSAEVALGSGVEELVADFVLVEAAPIEGRVVDQDGRPVAHASVCIKEPGYRSGSKQFCRGHDEIGPDGRFSFPDATAGLWDLTVQAPRPAEDWICPRLRIVRGGDRSVEVVLRYEPGRARFEADIVDATSGLAVDPAEVRVRKSTGALRGAPTFKARTAVGRVTVDRLRPGDYVIEVRLADGSRSSQTFTVKPEDTFVRIRMAIGKPAVVTVRVDLAAIPAAERPKSIAVFTNPGDAARWVTSPGQPAPNATRGYGGADASNDWTVRFEDVTPNVPIRFWLDGPLHAAGRITVGFGEDKALVLRPTPGVRVTFTGRAGASGCRLVLFVKDTDGTWSPVNWATWEPGKEWRSSERFFAPGHLEWRAERFDPESDRDDADAVVEGALDLAAGEAREVPIAFP